jgi:hypothetical protein
MKVQEEQLNHYVHCKKPLHQLEKKQLNSFRNHENTDYHKSHVHKAEYIVHCEKGKRDSGESKMNSGEV